ncbi:pectate lyase [Segatella hominis]|uniref:pectate lyase n=1 Tax=Segatella hominis TaxID=2518605 RepID=UPI001C4711C5|nr:pectate lyase [Segatella hominis]WOZ81698.1 pectate lyase [Segatella hominis]
MKQKVFTLLAASLISAASMAQAPAFPGAEGHGRYVTGGRGGKIVHVTNLNDSGTGSFREAVKSGNKIIVFDVAGVIALKSDLKFADNITILGQTAPSPGITLRYYTVQPGSNNIIRFLRIRRGQEKDINDGADASWQRNKTGIIYDHCSLSWSIDEVASFYDNNNFTMQWCTVAESLTNPGHSKGAHGYGGIWGGKLASFHHNFVAHLMNRGPRFNGARYGWTGYTSNKDYDTYKWQNTVQAENVDFRNCVMYNAQGTCYGGPGGGQINIVNNYYKAGPSHSLKGTTLNGLKVDVSTGKERGSQDRITLVTLSTQSNSDKNHPELYDMTSRYYINGNTTETTKGQKTENKDWKGISYDKGIPSLNGEYYSPDANNYYGDAVAHTTISGKSCVKIKMDEPAPTGQVTTHSAAEAYEKVLAYVGASLYRDEIDARYMEEAKTGTATYKGSITQSPGIIDKVSDVNGYTEDNFGTGTRPADFDTDKDGIPDEWEKANGLNPNDASDALTYSLDEKGYYTNIEVYANSLVENIMKVENQDALSEVDEYYPTTVSTGISQIENNQEVGNSAIKSITYYTLNGTKLPTPNKGVNIRKIELTNGTIKTDKVIK